MKLSKFINRFIFSVALISTTLVFLLSIIFQYMNLESDKIRIKNDFIETQKKELKKEIDIVFKLIEHENEIIERINNNKTLTNEFKKENEAHLLEWLASYRFGENGYIFVNNLNKQALIWDGKKLDTPMNYPNEELYKKQLEAIKNPYGGFFISKFKKLNTIEEFEKIYYVKEFKEFGWIVGTGVYLNEIENELIKKEELFKQTIENQIKSFIIIFILILIGVYVISRKLSKYIKTNIKTLTKSFEISVAENTKIDTNNLTYKEFKTLADKLNVTLGNKNQTEKALEDYINIVDENVIISTTDKNGIITDVSQAFCKISGYTKKELIGCDHSIVKHPDTPPEFYKNMWDTLLSGKTWKGEIRNRSKDGKDYWVFAVIKPIFRNYEIVGFNALRTNITNKKYIEQLSITDELTQLYNRRHFNIKIEEEINRAKRDDKYFTLLIIDIDYFKQYNDTYGHQKGDVALEKVASVLKTFTNRVSDFAFRLGGEEFGIITALDKEKAIDFATAIREKVEALKIEHSTSEVSSYITISIGISSRKGFDITNNDAMYKEADDALYDAKNLGRNCIFMQ